MKKNLLVKSLLAVCILSVQTLSAQNTTPYWSLAGNSNASAASKLGTTNSIPLRLFTNNAERLRIDANGKISIGTASPIGKLTVLNNGTVPATPWKSNSTLFTGFGEGTSGSADFIINMASNTGGLRPVYIGKRSRGTLAAPLAVADKDLLFSLLAAAYDGKSFQYPATIDFVADGAPAAGSVPTSISFVTGAKGSTRQERLSIGSNGSFAFNKNQLTMSYTGTLGTVGSEQFMSLNNGQIRMNNYEEDAEAGGYPSGIVKIKSGNVRISTSDDENPFSDSTAALSVYAYNKNGLFIESESEGIKVKSLNSGLSIVNELENGINVVSKRDNAIHAVSESSNSAAVYAEGQTGIIAKGVDPDNNSKGVVATGGTEGVRAVSLGVDFDDSHTSAVYGFANSNGVGVRGISESGPGLLGRSTDGHGVYGTTAGDTAYAGFFAGRVYSSGGFVSASDSKLKKSIKDLPEGLSIINKLVPKSYEFRNDGNFSLMNLPKGQHYGLIAQEVEKVLPTLVHNAAFNSAYSIQPPVLDSTGNEIQQSRTKPVIEIIEYKAINYTELIPVLIKATQEQQEEISNLRDLAEVQQKQINELKELVQKLTETKNTTSAINSATIGQSTPNPAKGLTRISYNIPGGSQNARLLITDNAGRTIRSIQLTGSGNVDVNTTALSSGIYNYSLIIDNKTVQTRKMTVAR